jgi:hypothetical protein
VIRRKVLAAGATGAISLGMVFATSGVASAAGPTFPNSGYGFDGNAHLIVGAGSTTLFRMAQSLASLWEDTEACTTNYQSYNTAGSSSPYTYPQTSPAFNQCSPATGQTYAGDEAGGNFDADTVAIAEPAGSSTGIASLNGAHAATAGVYAYEGTNTNLATTGDPNGQDLGSGVEISNGYGTVDFDLSSRAAKTSGGNCATPDPNNGDVTGDELGCDTFWGIASDGVGVYTFDSSSGVFNSSATNPANVGLSAQDLFDIFDCTVTTWGDLPEWQAANAAGYANLPPSAAPIVPWGMNSNSGTFGDFDAWIAKYATGVPSGWTVDQGCDRALTTTGGTALGPYPLENDFKPLIVEAGTNEYDSALYTWPTGTGDEGSPYTSGETFPAGVTTTATTSPQDPANWIWFGSYGLLTEFPFTSCAGQTTPSCPAEVSTPTGAVSFTSGVNSVSDTTASEGTAPSQTNIQGGTYPIERILSMVTTKADADCPLTTTTTPPSCDFATSVNPGPTNGNGETDFDVLGPTSGKGGAVREFIRFLCRPGTGTFAAGTNIAPADYYTGVTVSASSATGTNGEINTNAVETSGFRPVPISDRSTGSTCDVQSYG